VNISLAIAKTIAIDRLFTNENRAGIGKKTSQSGYWKILQQRHSQKRRAINKVFLDEKGLILDDF